MVHLLLGTSCATCSCLRRDGMSSLISAAMGGAYLKTSMSGANVQNRLHNVYLCDCNGFECVPLC